MSVDLSKIQRGDEVLVRLTVDDLSSNKERIYWSAAAGAYVLASSVIEHSPTIAVGDRVRERGIGQPGTILFADERDTVVRWDEGGIHSGPTATWATRLERSDV